MMFELKNFLLLGISFLGLFGLAECVYRLTSVKAEYTRKGVHIGTGLLSLTFPFLLNNHWQVLILCSIFATILIASLRFKWLPSINKIDRKSVGSLAYPLAVYICYLTYQYNSQNYIFYYLPILILAVCDPIAAIIGRNFQWGKFNIAKDSKTLSGSLGFLFIAFLITFSYTNRTDFGNTILSNLFIALTVGILSSISEALSKKGWDNLTIPISVIFGLTLFQYIST